MVNIQTPFLASNQALLARARRRCPRSANNLFTFMANRLNMSFTNLNCQNFGLTNPVTVTLDGNGAATAATFNTTQQQATTTTAAGSWHDRHRDGAAREPRSGKVAVVRAPAAGTSWTRPACNTRTPIG